MMFLVSILAIALALTPFLFAYMSWDLNLISSFFSGLTAISLLIAYFSFKANLDKQKEEQHNQHDKEILSQAITSLKWAFETLINGDPSIIPVADRLNWLTSARHIQRYYSIRELLLTDTYKLICSENEEYWRHRFYVLLNRRELSNSNYFTDSRNTEWQENIEISSAMVISEFSQWSDNTEDPLNAVDRDSLEAQGAFNGVFGRALSDYVERLNPAFERRNDDSQ